MLFKFTNTQLLNRLRKCSDCTFISLRAVVAPTMTKTGNPFHGRVLKLVSAAGTINVRYSRVVNLQRARESKPADFQAKERSWGSKLPDCPIVEYTHKDGTTHYYLDFKIQARTDQYRDIETGRVITKDQLEEWLRPPQKTRQGVEKRIAWRDFRIDRICEMRIQGDVWQVRSGMAKLERLLKGNPK
jgi:hypothetical protein